MNQRVVKVQLLTKREDPGGYIIYVFLNLDQNEYIMCTRFPNWDAPLIKEQDEGFLSYKEVQGGVDNYYDVNNDTIQKYLYDNLIFLNFVYKKNEILV